MLAADTGRAAPGERLRALVPGLPHDFHDVARVDGAMAAVETPTLVLSGTRSARFLEQAARALATVVPHARHVVLHGLDHCGPWNASRGGRPDAVARALRGALGTSRGVPPLPVVAE